MTLIEKPKVVQEYHVVLQHLAWHFLILCSVLVITLAFVTSLHGREVMDMGVNKEVGIVEIPTSDIKSTAEMVDEKLTTPTKKTPYQGCHCPFLSFSGSNATVEIMGLKNLAGPLYFSSLFDDFGRQFYQSIEIKKKTPGPDLKLYRDEKFGIWKIGKDLDNESLYCYHPDPRSNCPHKVIGQGNWFRITQGFIPNDIRDDQVKFKCLETIERISSSNS